jgi:transcriptional regulator of acetoin/glycerol metabolism
MASLASPVVYLDAVAPAFPSTVVGTLIVRNVERLVAAHQEQFLQWLDAQIEIARVITTSPRSLFPRVQRGTFSERLYYRLNTVIVELNSSMTT